MMPRRIQPEQDDPTRQPSFTTLDGLLILAAVNTAQGIEGALDEDQLDDVVDELVKLNASRHQSYFHAGYPGRALRQSRSARNCRQRIKSRLRWYWTGAVQGWARRERWDCIVREHATNPVIKELGNGTNGAVGGRSATYRRGAPPRRPNDRAPAVRRRCEPWLRKTRHSSSCCSMPLPSYLAKGDAAKALPSLRTPHEDPQGA